MIKSKKLNNLKMRILNNLQEKLYFFISKIYIENIQTFK